MIAGTKHEQEQENIENCKEQIIASTEQILTSEEGLIPWRSSFTGKAAAFEIIEPIDWQARLGRQNGTVEIIRNIKEATNKQ